MPRRLKEEDDGYERRPHTRVGCAYHTGIDQLVEPTDTDHIIAARRLAMLFAKLGYADDIMSNRAGKRTCCCLSTAKVW